MEISLGLTLNTIKSCEVGPGQIFQINDDQGILEPYYQTFDLIGSNVPNATNNIFVIKYQNNMVPRLVQLSEGLDVLVVCTHSDVILKLTELAQARKRSIR